MREEQTIPKEKIKETHYYHYDKEKKVVFRANKLFLGALTAFIGVFLLMDKFGFARINLKIGLWDLWPILIILVGLSMFNFRSFIGIFFGIIVSLSMAIIVAMILFGHLEVQGESLKDLSFHLTFSAEKTINNK